MFTLSNRTISYALLAVLVVILGLFSINAFAASPSSPDAAALLQQAKEARTAAHKVVCAKLGGYVNECFNGDKTMCDKMDKALVYGMGEFDGIIPPSDVLPSDVVSFLDSCRSDGEKSFQ